MDLADLGLTPTELQDRVVDRLAERILEGQSEDDDGHRYPTETQFQRKLKEKMTKHIDDAVSSFADRVTAPVIGKLVETIELQESSRWGDKVGKPSSFREYIVARAELYLTQKVDKDGKGYGESYYSSSDANQTRAAYLVTKHLDASIQSAMKSALSDANSKIATTIADVVKERLSQIVASFPAPTLTK